MYQFPWIVESWIYGFQKLSQVNSVVDFNITLSESAVAALTSIATFDDAYDAAIYSAIVSGPTSGAYSPIATASGKVLDFGSNTAAINGAAGAAFAYSGGVATLKASALTVGAKFQTLKAAAITLSNAVGPCALVGDVAQATPTALSNVAITGDLTYNTNTPITVTLTGCTVTGTISNTGSALVTVTKVNTTIGTVGANIVTQQFATISAPNLLSGSRVRLYNDDDDVEIYNGVLSSAGFSFEYPWLADKNITLTATYCVGLSAMLEFSASGIVNASGATFTGSQVADAVYTSLAVDGSAVTGFSADYVNDEINFTAADDFAWADGYAWWVYNTTTESGIREFFGGITAVDQANFRLNAGVVSIYLDNTTSTSIVQLDNRRIYRSDGAYPVRSPTSGGGGIDVCWRDQVFVAAGSMAAAVFDAEIEAGYTFKESVRLTNSVLAGKVSGAGTGTEVFRDLADTKDRVISTVDAQGNRTAVVRDGT